MSENGLFPLSVLQQWESCLKALDRQGVRVVRLDADVRRRLIATWDSYARVWPGDRDMVWQQYFRRVLLLERRKA